MSIPNKINEMFFEKGNDEDIKREHELQENTIQIIEFGSMEKVLDSALGFASSLKTNVFLFRRLMKEIIRMDKEIKQLREDKLEK